MTKILALHARQILDSRGKPTVEVDLKTKFGVVRASAPSGASTGAHEAHELRDNTKAYAGNAVTHAVQHVNRTIARKLKHKPIQQALLDHEMCALDGTYNKSKFGANAILPVSLALAKAQAQAERIPLYTHIAQLARAKPKLPRPFANIINGGKHAGNGLAFQEYMIVAHKTKSFEDTIRVTAEFYYALKATLQKKYGKSAINVGDEGGFAPNIAKVEEPLKLLTKVANQIGVSNEIKFALDAAASEFHTKNKYLVDNKLLTAQKLTALYEKLAGTYPIYSIEDPFNEESFSNFALLKQTLKKTQIVGDDLLTTNPGRIHQAIDQDACNALLLKVNQIGTLTQALDAHNLAKQHEWNTMVSHRSGETTDTYIADIATGLGCGQIKSGAPARGERVAKYNQLLRIEEASNIKLADLN